MIYGSWPRTALLVALTALVAAACSKSGQRPVRNGPITLAITNARVWTADAANPWAQAVAIRDDEISLVGTNEQVRRAAADAKTIDAGGRLIVPGFIDSHVHFIDG